MMREYLYEQKVSVVSLEQAATAQSYIFGEQTHKLLFRTLNVIADLKPGLCMVWRIDV